MRSIGLRDHRYGDDQRNLAHVSHDQLADGFTRILAGCVALLIVNATTRLVIAIGPFATTTLSHTWRRQRTDLPTVGITCIPLT